MAGVTELLKEKGIMSKADKAKAAAAKAKAAAAKVQAPAEFVPHKEPSSTVTTIGNWLKGLLGKRKGDMVKNYARGGGVRPASNEYR